MDAIGAYPHRMSDTERRACLRRAVIASTVGTTIEWYDFLIYSVVTGLVFGNLFFPDADPVVGALKAHGCLTVDQWSTTRELSIHRQRRVIGCHTVTGRSPAG